MSRALPLAVALLTLAPAVARAYEDQASVDLAVGGSSWGDAPGVGGLGGGLSLGGTWGAGDVINLRGALGYRLQGGPVHLLHGRLEAAYLVDIVQWVPFFGLGLEGWFAVGGEGDHGWVPGGHLLLGLDYLLSREWNIGLDVRTGVIRVSGGAHANLGGALRVSRVIDLF